MIPFRERLDAITLAGGRTHKRLGSYDGSVYRSGGRLPCLPQPLRGSNSITRSQPKPRGPECFRSFRRFKNSLLSIASYTGKILSSRVVIRFGASLPQRVRQRMCFVRGSGEYGRKKSWSRSVCGAKKKLFSHRSDAGDTIRCATQSLVHPPLQHQKYGRCTLRSS